MNSDHKKKIIYFIIFLFCMYLIAPSVLRVNVNSILESDQLNIYDNNDNLIATLNSPIDLFGSALINKKIMVARPGKFDILPRKKDLSQLYTLVFIKDGSIKDRLDVLIPSNEKGTNRIKNLSIGFWDEYENQYIILYKNRQFFSFGQDFYNNLFNFINEN